MLAKSCAIVREIAEDFIAYKVLNVISVGV
jgi:hypothetical protein